MNEWGESIVSQNEAIYKKRINNNPYKRTT